MVCRCGGAGQAMLRGRAHGRPAAFRDHERMALAAHGWAGFHRTAGQFHPSARAHRAAAGPPSQTDAGFRPHRTIPPRDSQQIIAASPPAEAGTMVAAGAFGNRPTESVPAFARASFARREYQRAISPGEISEDVVAKRAT